MSLKKAFIYSLSLFLLICLYFWIEKLLGYPPRVEVTNDQDAIVQGVRRTVGVMLGFVVSALLFMLLTLYVYLKRVFISVFQKNP
ncbi:hypothetical protein VC178_08405 [Polynucleobacter sp. AP-Sanab-80-C2]|uniref:hypothetical protein n=1 Tax=Polynucleobacter sp. AP-Sanab-80-C2 TaxID=3108274 RepID=UPI002B22FB2C|nr:hypothetical protein [Polynucleobacter sp. AP-Sanab-80-C2]MEA9599908.1 hypothetical protein [Polynucleobacter sp. AP-Sanab-80-C2]